jgi:hypothetical protein
MTDSIYRVIAGVDFSKGRTICEHGIYANPDSMFSNADINAIRTIPAEAITGIFDHLARAFLLTRRQKQLVALLDDGWVFELAKPGLHQKVSRRYLMRGPKSHETDGPVVTAKMVERLIELGFAIKVRHDWADKTWVYSRANYERSPMGSQGHPKPEPPLP